MNEETIQTNQTPNIRGWTRSWYIFRSAWRVLSLDKEVLVIPLVAGLVSLVIAVVGYVGGYALSQNTNSGNLLNYSTVQSNNQITHVTYAAWIATSAILTLIGTYTLAAVVSITLERLRGQDPTISSGLAQVKRKFGPLTAFGLLSFGVVQILQLIRDRVPFIGAKIVAFLGETAWRVAAFFAIPIIVDSSQKVGPIDAAKQSLHMIRNSWREAAGSQFGVGFVILMVVIAEILIGLIGGVLAFSAAGEAGAVTVGVIAGIALLATILVSTTISGIAKAALYYYASTGEAPEAFDKQLMREAFTAKKARKIFS